MFSSNAKRLSNLSNSELQERIQNKVISKDECCEGV